MMSRNFGISNVRTDLGGRYEHPPARYGADTRADLNSFPLQPPLHCEDVCDPPLNVVGVIRDAILGSITGVAIAVSVFILLFVRV
jgi:hypothetical protein